MLYSSLSKIARDLDLIVQEVHRNINRLFEAGLVKKESGSYYFLTTFGESVLLQLSSLKFLSENKGYFSDHTLGELPLKFIQRIERIGALDNSQFLGSSVSIFECIRELFDLSHRYIYAILSEIPMYFIESASQVLKRGVAMKYLIPHNAVLPKNRHNESEHQKFQELLKRSQVERRMVDNVQISFVMNEIQAMVMFPTSNGRSDLNCCFYSKESAFHEWCVDYFNYRWRNSRPFDSKELLEV